MMFPDGAVKEGVFENNVFMREIPLSERKRSPVINQMVGSSTASTFDKVAPNSAVNV